MARKRNLVLLVFLVSALTFYSIQAQNQDKDTIRYNLDEVTIMGTRIPVSAARLSRAAVVIPSTLIRESPRRELAELLGYLPDADVRTRGPLGIQSDLSLRGGTFEQSAVLINGINLNDPQTGHFHLDLPLPLSLVHQIEVLPGSDPKSLGAGALAGAVNLVTARPEKRILDLQLSGGRWGLLDLQVALKSPGKKVWHQEGVQYQRSSGYIGNTDFEKLTASAESGLTAGRFEASVFGGLLLKSFGANSFYTPKYPNQYESGGTGLGMLHLTWKGPVVVKQSLYARVHYDEFELFRSDAPTWYAGPNRHLTRIAGSRTDAWMSHSLGTTAIGIEFRNESIQSTVLGKAMTEPAPIPFTDSLNFLYSAARFHTTATAEHRFNTGPVKWTGSLVFHLVESSRRYANFYPGIEMSVPIKTYFTWFVVANRGFRLPTFTELYYKSPTHSGNPDLLPESAWHAETGTRLHAGPVMLSLTGFYRFAPQSIDWVRLPQEQIWHSENLGRIVTYGTEMNLFSSVSLPLVNKLKLDRFELGFRYYFQHHAATEYYSQYVLDYLRWKLTGGINVSWDNRLMIHVRAMAQDRAGSYTVWTSEGQAGEKEYEPFWLLDLRISYRIGQFILFAECSNLFGSHYYDFGNLPQPGAWYRAGFVAQIMPAGRTR